MSRKSYHRKHRSCSLCRPHKRGLSVRWIARDLMLLRRFEKTLRAAADWDNS